ncbi:hypothetical protein AMECASPLE_020717 [Ameca splendens]|uniref:Uncharacterized protein n=1 Tax=Ameca splendens TaxID=208324 RepID=A0ABV0YQ89_9TELE
MSLSSVIAPACRTLQEENRNGGVYSTSPNKTSWKQVVKNGNIRTKDWPVFSSICLPINLDQSPCPHSMMLPVPCYTVNMVSTTNSCPVNRFFYLSCGSL